MNTHTNIRIDQKWNILQEPIKPTNLPSSYLLLLAAIDAGWRIKEPVAVFKSEEYERSSLYQFVLYSTENSQVILLAIPNSPEVTNYITVEGLKLASDDIH
jgi:hypothetical protein